MRKTCGIGLLTVLIVTVAAARPSAQTIDSFDRFQSWLRAVDAQRVGDADAAVGAIGRWSASDIELVLPPVFAYLEHARGQDVSRSPACPGGTSSVRERQRLLGETRRGLSAAVRLRVESLPVPASLDVFILQAAALHTEAALLDPLATQSADVKPPTNVLRGRREARAADGQFQTMARGGAHWAMARALLQFLPGEPSPSPLARQWFSAASAFLVRGNEFAQLVAHFEATAELFPDDPELAFDLGWQSETHASALVQEDVRQTISTLLRRSKTSRSGDITRGGRCPPAVPCDEAGNPLGVKGVRESLFDAERHFAHAIALAPGFTEAHIRLAHVRALLGRHSEADAALRQLPASTDAFVNFYAHLLHGASLDALDRRDDARAAYERALDLFPDAQSAHLAMSAMADRYGDRGLALRHAALALTDVPDGSDPFEVYRLGRGRDANQLWDRFRASLTERR